MVTFCKLRMCLFLLVELCALSGNNHSLKAVQIINSKKVWSRSKKMYSICTSCIANKKTLSAPNSLIIGIGAGNFLGVRRIFFPDFPNLPENLFCTNFPLQIFCSYWYIIFSSNMLPYMLHFSDGRLILPWRKDIRKYTNL